MFSQVPKTPDGLEGKADEAGKLTITWNVNIRLIFYFQFNNSLRRINSKQLLTFGL